MTEESIKLTQSPHSPVKMIFSPTSKASTHTSQLLEQQGVRIAHLTPKKTPETTLQLMQSPSGTTYRKVQETHLGVLGKEVTPEKEIAKIGTPMIERALKENVYVHDNLQPMVQTQTIDKEILANSKNESRPKTTSAMKDSVNALFFCPSKRQKMNSAEQMDWCHLTAHQFLGPTNAENLVPGTHQSNLYALHGIENPLAKCVRESSEIKSVSTTVIATFSKKPVVPTQIEYVVDYKAEERTVSEHFYVNPQSRRSLSKAEQAAIQTIRTGTLKDGLEDDEERANNLSSAFTRS